MIPIGSTATTLVAATAGSITATMGTLTMDNGSTLNLTATSTTSPAYGMTYGATTLNGDPNIFVGSVSSGSGVLTLGALNDGGAAATLNLTGPGIVEANAPDLSLIASSSINVAAGTLISETSTSLGSATVTVGSAGTLEGSGSTGTLTVNGILTPGIGGPGSFSSGSLSFGSSGVYNVDLNGAAASSGYSQLTVNGPINLNGAALNLSLGYTPTFGTSYILINNSGGTPIEGYFAGLPEGSLITLGGLPFTLTYQGGSSGDDVVLTQGEQTAIALGSSDNPSVYGETLIFVADIFAAGNTAATGTVTFSADNTALGTIAVGNDGNSGEATFSTSSLQVGVHIITATYNPTNGSEWLGSSTNISQVVNQDPANLNLSSSLNPTVFGGAVTFTATATPTGLGSGVPTGTVTFYDGSTPLATESLASGSATYSTSALAVGKHIITANYSGDTNFTSASSSPLTQYVNPTSAPSVVSVVVNGNQVQRSMVTSIQVTFNDPVDPTALQSAFTLTCNALPNGGAGDGATIGVISVATSTNSSGNTVATLTFSGANTEGGSIGDGIWTLNVNHADVVSGTLQMASDYQQTQIIRLFGDYDGTGVVDSADLGVFGTTFGLTSTSPGFIAAFDHDGNGIIDSTDLGRFGTNFGLTI